MKQKKSNMMTKQMWAVRVHGSHLFCHKEMPDMLGIDGIVRNTEKEAKDDSPKKRDRLKQFENIAQYVPKSS